jgi:hypothetical protein
VLKDRRRRRRGEWHRCIRRTESRVVSAWSRGSDIHAISGRWKVGSVVSSMVEVARVIGRSSGGNEGNKSVLRTELGNMNGAPTHRAINLRHRRVAGGVAAAPSTGERGHSPSADAAQRVDGLCF